MFKPIRILTDNPSKYEITMKSHIIKHYRHEDCQKELDEWLKEKNPEDIVQITFTVSQWLNADLYWFVIIYKTS